MGALSTIQNAVKDLLEASAYFADVPVYVESEKDLGRKVEIATAKQKGVCVVVMTPEGDQVDGRSLDVNLDSVAVIVRCFEHPTRNRSANGTGKTAQDIAETVAVLTKRQVISPEEVLVDWARPLITVGDDPRFYAYDVNLNGYARLTFAISQVATPAVAEAAGSVTITSATAGAVIFYTTDGSVPNSGANLYAGTFAAPEAGTVIRARAYLPGYQASAIGAATITGAAFDPVVDLAAKLRLWLDPTRQDITADANVASLTDYGPGAVHAVQGTTANKPVAKSITNGAATFKACLYDGVDDFLRCPANAVLAPVAEDADGWFSLVVVLNRLGSIPSVNETPFALMRENSTAQGGIGLLSATSAQKSREAWQFWTGNTLHISGQTDFGTYSEANPWGWVVLEIAHENGLLSFYENGTLKAQILSPYLRPAASSFDTPTEIYKGNGAAEPELWLGARRGAGDNPASAFAGFISSVGYFDELSDSERSQLTAALMAQHGIP